MWVFPKVEVPICTPNRIESLNGTPPQEVPPFSENLVVLFSHPEERERTREAPIVTRCASAAGPSVLVGPLPQTHRPPYPKPSALDPRPWALNSKLN